MKSNLWFFCAVLGLLFSPVQVGAYSPIRVAGSPNSHGPEAGSLVIIGGGEVKEPVWDSIVALAGGPDRAMIVVVTNASGDRPELYAKAIEAFKTRLGEQRVSVMHLKSVAEANDPGRLEILEEATGVYFSGGRQWRIAEVYLNTLAHEFFRDVLGRDGVIAGSSAGASIQGSFLWRGDTSGPDILVGDHTQGLGFLRNSVIDQHLLVRNRQNDLTGFISLAPHYMGLGLDESTAVIVKGDRFRVVGQSYVAVYGPEGFQLLREGDRYDMKNRIVINSQAE